MRSLYHADLDDDRNFTLVVDASRFSPERLVELLLAAGGVVQSLGCDVGGGEAAVHEERRAGHV